MLHSGRIAGRQSAWAKDQTRCKRRSVQDANLKVGPEVTHAVFLLACHVLLGKELPQRRRRRNVLAFGVVPDRVEEGQDCVGVLDD